jgi:hypothetical protein
VLKESAMKFFTLISAGAGQDRKQFQHWFLKEHAPMVLEPVKGAQRYIVNLADVTPPPVENMTGLAPEVTPAYDVITGARFQGPGAAVRLRHSRRRSPQASNTNQDTAQFRHRFWRDHAPQVLIKCESCSVGRRDGRFGHYGSCCGWKSACRFFTS